MNGGSGNDVMQAEVHARGGSTGSLSLDIYGGTDVDGLCGVLDIASGATLRASARMHVGFFLTPDLVLPGTTPNIVRVFNN